MTVVFIQASSPGGRPKKRKRVGRKPGSVLKFKPLRVVIYLGLLLPEASSGTPKTETGKRPTLVSLDLASNWGLPSQHLSVLLVRSYRTFAPLPKRIKSLGGMFLWHYPHGHPHWALPSKSGLSGARTFLRFATKGKSATAFAYSLPLSSLISAAGYLGWRARVSAFVKSKGLTEK